MKYVRCVWQCCYTPHVALNTYQHEVHEQDCIAWRYLVCLNINVPCNMCSRQCVLQHPSLVPKLVQACCWHPAPGTFYCMQSICQGGQGVGVATSTLLTWHGAICAVAEPSAVASLQGAVEGYVVLLLYQLLSMAAAVCLHACLLMMMGSSCCSW